METLSAFPSPSWIILSHHSVFYPSLRLWLWQEHSQSQHRWFRNPHRMCHGPCAQPLLRAEPVPCVLLQQEIPKLLNLCLLHNGKITNHLEIILVWGSQAGCQYSFFQSKSQVVQEFFSWIEFSCRSGKK